jgi:hypothetical protein
LSLA